MRGTHTDHSPTPDTVTAGSGASPAGRRPGTRTNNPLRISRIGSDHLQVHIRAPSDCTELLALVERLERLIDVGYDAIEVVFENPSR